jgi:hypothetical protein
MSNTPLSQPPEPIAPPSPSASSPPSPPDPAAATEGVVRRLRAELAASTDKARQARLLCELADIAERTGDEPAAARDYLAAFNAEPTFREPLEGLVRLLEKRRSLKNLGKLVEALARAASAPDEKVRALLMRAWYQADVGGDLADAKALAHEASAVEGAPASESASAWLALEVLSGRAGDLATREEALAARTEHAHEPTWRALLLIDRARMAAGAGETGRAVALLEEARVLGSRATWTATWLLEQVARVDGSPTSDEERARAEVHANARDQMAVLIQDAMLDPARGDALGVPLAERQSARMLDGLLRSAEARRQLGQLDQAAAILDRALAGVASLEGEDARLAEAAIIESRIRIAERTGDVALAAQLAERRLASETDRGLAAGHAMRLAELAGSHGDGPRALEALSRAIASDPGCLPARALQLDMLADSDPSAFAAQLESFADQLATDEARGRAFLLAAYVWAAMASDVAGAKAALSQATMFGVPHPTASRIGRALASLSGDSAWFEEATKRLAAAGATESEIPGLFVELARLRAARGDYEAAAKALHELGATPKGAWLGRVLEAFLPAGAEVDPEQTVAAKGGRARVAVEELAAAETDHDQARSLSLIAAMRAHLGADVDGARKQLRELADRDASDVLASTYLADLDRFAGDHASAARVVSDAAAATTDMELAAALRLEAGLERWRAGDRKGALEEIEAAMSGATDAAKMVLGWASRGVDPDTIDGRRRAIERAREAQAPSESRALTLEAFATEVGGGDPEDAAAALAAIERSPEGDLSVAAALARLAWRPGAADPDALRAAIARVASLGPRALLLAAAERVRVAREAGDVEELVRATMRWHEAGGGLPAALEWLAAATALGSAQEEAAARAGVAASLDGEERQAMLASAALVAARLNLDEPMALVPGDSTAVRLTNLELSPPGCDPRRRVAALTMLDGALGEEAAIDATGLSGWSSLAAGDIETARSAFQYAASARPSDLAAWEGLRACAEMVGDSAARARAAAELGARCLDGERGSAFWEEAALIALELGDDASADYALDAAFARHARRDVAFDKLFRRVRERKDNDKLLALIERRLEVIDEPREILKLYWEQARALREKGDQAAALSALEHVTMLDPDHVGALALLGEINIRRSNFDDAAVSLARLATLEAAPAKNRVTAGVAAVDLYENKLGRFDKALEVLVALHRAKLSTLPVRERLARAAMKTGSWDEATAILEELMTERPAAAGRIEAARLAMAIHRDRRNDPQRGARAIVKLLEEAPGDPEAVDMLLKTEHPPSIRDPLLAAARTSLVDKAQQHPTDAALVHLLSRVARAQGDDALHHATLGTLVALGVGDPQVEQALAQVSARKPRAPQIAISGAMMRAILAPGDEAPIADLFMVLGPTLAEALGPNLQACGVGRRDKIDPRSGLSLRNEIAAWAGAFGIQEFDLYVGGNDRNAVVGIPGEPPALVVGPGINGPLAPAVRARVARELFAIARGTTVVRMRDDISIAAIVVAACKQAEVPIEHPSYAVLAEIDKLVGKAMSRKTRKLLPDVCSAVASRRTDARAWSARALASHDRVATVASGEPSVVVGEVGAGPRAEELLRFVLSPGYLDLRRALGLEGS